MATVVTKLHLIHPGMGDAFLPQVHQLINDVSRLREVDHITAWSMIHKSAGPRWVAGGMLCWAQVNVAARWTEVTK